MILKGVDLDMKSFCETWEKIHKEQEWGKYPSESVIRFIARNYYKTKRENVKILDFGCGGVLIHGTWQEKALMYMHLMVLQVR